jgi:hypothetical protein
MGVYPTTCINCNENFMWFSGLPAQICSTCWNARNMTPATDKDIDKFMEDNSDLMDMLSKQEEKDKLRYRLQELKNAHELIGQLIEELEDACKS